MWGRLFVILVAAIFGWTAAADAQTRESRVALVVGNGAYSGDAALRNPVNDATAMGRALESAGFTVIQRVNAGRREMLRAVHEFRARLQPGGVAVFYFAGHGVQVRGANYLIPIDAALEQESDLRAETVDVNEILSQLEEVQNSLTLVILDACRNNPFERRFRSIQRGLAQVSGGPGTIIAYATAPGSVAADGDGSNGLFTEELLKAFATPGLKLEDALKRTAAAVQSRSQRRQVPWFTSSYLGDFYFSGAPTAAAAPTPTLPVPPPPAPQSVDQSRRDCPSCPDMVRIPAGSFLMGADTAEEEREGMDGWARDRSIPRKRITLRRGFSMSRTEITVAQFRAFLTATNRDMGSECWTWSGKWAPAPGLSWRNPGFPQSDDHPVACISWHDATAYAQWLSQRTGRRYRLASEAEWEYAARAGSSTARYWGDAWQDGDRYATVDTKLSGTSTAGSRQPNAFGLHDMLGNLWEWTLDVYNKGLAAQPDDGSPRTIGGGGLRVLRGGSWAENVKYSRAGYREGFPAQHRGDRFGIRVLRED